ncbi:heparinase II/III domain-containing protein [Corticicoccus populi]|uniref:Heparinase II/III family protein n=1 Tax=Corticicoccus populi TaxID=1812821 RepID=A0ABW5WXG3_9STAP
MSIFKEKNFYDFIIEYDRIKSNDYSNEDVTRIFEKVAEKNDCSLKYGKSKSDRILIFDNNVIGGMRGSKPSTTSSQAVSICNQQAVLEEYLRIVKQEETEAGQLVFNIRITIVEGTVAAALLKIPKYIIGNGINNIEELIDKKNSERRQKAFYKNHEIKFDAQLSTELNSLGLKLSDVLPENRVCIINDDLNVLNGAESLDVTHNISDEIKETALNAVAAVPGLYTAGVDLSLDYIESDETRVDGISLSISTLIHYLPYKGKSVQVLDYYIKSLISSYKNKNNLKLSEYELNLFDSLSEFENRKKNCMRNFLKYDIKGILELSIDDKSKKELIEEKEKLEMEERANISIGKGTFYIDESFSSNLNVQEKDVLRLFKHNKNTKKIAKKALKNEIIPFPNFDSVPLDINYYKTDKSEKYGTSYQLYIQSLRSCTEVLLEFEKSKDIRYLFKAKEIIYMWIDFVNAGTEEKMVWYDHPTAYRTQTIIHFIYLAKLNDLDIDDRLFTAVLKKHGDVLMDESLYRNNNHGLMMDKSLLVLGNVLSNQLFFSTGYHRAIETFYYSFSAQGIHLENSPDYHNMVVKMYNEIERYLKLSGKSFNKTILGYLNLSSKYLDTIKAPNNRLPAIGDSNNTIRKSPKYYNNFCDVEAGIGVLQYNKEKPFYTNFICGYSSQVHKHKDDFAVGINYNGEDFIIDAGKFNYNRNSPIRNYMISTEAHSVFSLKDYSYDIKANNRFTRNIKISGYNFNDQISFIKGTHADYNNTDTRLARTVMQIDGLPVFIIVDDCLTDSLMNFSQVFNLHEKIKVTQKNDKYYLEGKNETLVIKQFVKVDSGSIILGDRTIPAAVNTTGFGEVTETKQIKFEKCSDDYNIFLTAIYDENEINELTISYINKELKIVLNDKEYCLSI